MARGPCLRDAMSMLKGIELVFLTDWNMPKNFEHMSPSIPNWTLILGVKSSQQGAERPKVFADFILLTWRGPHCGLLAGCWRVAGGLLAGCLGCCFLLQTMRRWKAQLMGSLRKSLRWFIEGNIYSKPSSFIIMSLFNRKRHSGQFGFYLKPMHCLDAVPDLE